MKEYYADFHCHSRNSDGKYEVQDIINMARKANIKYLSLTDHNKLLDAIEIYQENNPTIVLIQGSEISTTLQFSSTGRSVGIHIIGLFLEANNELLTFLAQNNNVNNERFEKIIDNLKAFGIDLGSYQEIERNYPGRKISRMLIAQTMKDKGFVDSVETGMNKYIGDYGLKLAWEPLNTKYPSFNKTIDMIHRSKGVAILAHPLNYSLTNTEQEELFIRFRKAEGDAFELFYAAYSEEKRKKLKIQVDSLNLGLGYSCGSDFHGFMETDCINHKFPAELYHQMLKIRQKYL